jgi:hypothetical protein
MRPPRQSLGSAGGGSPASGRTCKDEARGTRRDRPRLCRTNGSPDDFDEVVAPDYLDYGHYDRETLAKDLSAHLVYGTATATHPTEPARFQPRVSFHVSNSIEEVPQARLWVRGLTGETSR